MWNIAFCSGCIFGPMFGGALEKVSFTYSMDVMAVVSLVLLLVSVSIIFCDFCKKD